MGIVAAAGGEEATSSDANQGREALTRRWAGPRS
jgi:hypothetical protein